MERSQLLMCSRHDTGLPLPRLPRYQGSSRCLGVIAMYVVTVEFTVKPESVPTFRPAMLKNAKASLETEPGCRQFDVCFGHDDHGVCFLYEVYDDRAAFDVHLSMPHFKSFDAEVAPMLDNKVVKIFELVQGTVLK
jgi:(4S)-4-hydroxy-5-phosphonooxypentane-2,3-dione isomerase